MANILEHKQQIHQNNNQDASDSGQSFMSSSSSSSSDGHSIDSLEEQSAIEQSAQNVVNQALNEGIVIQSTKSAAAVNATTHDKHEEANANISPVQHEPDQESDFINKEPLLENNDVKKSPTTSETADERIETKKSILSNNQVLTTQKPEPDIEPDSLTSVENAPIAIVESNKQISKPTLKQQVNSNNNNNIDELGGLNLNMTASEMRELLSRRKKFDPKKAQINIRQKYEIIQQM